eukprot:CAMPEP_0184400810 /NCGR_PEP_ID=MMETSP0007-20130409/76389_1 /TAXON_ID=97485 /ORGANISM="Prymnesium parvum, Strain Texoma1" /LENGTH=133 /DNA_ID=CAMNT_0026755921 /DNA_START=155 /DNA_END=552 /DNA_ORIENTATION=-
MAPSGDRLPGETSVLQCLRLSLAYYSLQFEPRLDSSSSSFLIRSASSAGDSDTAHTIRLPDLATGPEFLTAESSLNTCVLAVECLREIARRSCSSAKPRGPVPEELSSSRDWYHKAVRSACTCQLLFEGAASR